MLCQEGWESWVGAPVLLITEGFCTFCFVLNFQEAKKKKKKMTSEKSPQNPDPQK